MKKYKYTLRRGEETIEGTETAKDKSELFDRIRQEGDILVSVEEIGTAGSFLTRANDYLSRFSRVGMRDKILFAKNLAAMIGSGLSMSRALSVIKRQSSNQKFQDVVSDIEKSISKGNTFNEALSEHKDIFPQVFIAMARAGEESGQLKESLTIVGDQMERTHRLKKKIKGALMYPSVIVVAMIIIAILMLIYVVPTLTTTFKELGTELPASTQVIIWISDTLKNNTLLFLVGVIAAIGGFIAGLRTTRGKKIFDTTTLYIPVISGLVKEANSAATARTLSSLLSSGVEVVNALDITRDVVQHHAYSRVLDEAKTVIKKGGQMSEVFMKNEKLYPVFVGEMVAVGEETGRLSEMLENVAQYYEDDVQQKTKDLSTIIEPVLMVIVGAAVGFFAISMITPMYSIANEI